MEKIKIAIIDYNLGNLFSVYRACEMAGVVPEITSNPQDLLMADAAILPGVGAFKAAMLNLKSNGMNDAILEFVRKGKPFLGICLGLQLLFDSSEEFENAEGLGLIRGDVRKFQFEDSSINVPQITWNSIQQKNLEWENTPLMGIRNKEYLYFVHSYFVVPSSSDIVLTETSYHDFTYCSAIKQDNIFATQFHPEKSGPIGLRIYKNWINQLNIND